MVNTQQAWDNALIDIQSEISKANFNTWFKNTHIEAVKGGLVIIGVESDFILEWLSTKYHKSILKALRSVLPETRSVEYVISKKKPSPTPIVQENPLTSQIQKKETTSLAKELPLKEVYIDKETNLNPRYTFDSFIIGPFNELAYSAAQAIIKKPGVYNPLFIYGDTGLGKTHLIQAIGNELGNRYKNIKVYYTSSEKFTSDLVNAFQKNQSEIQKVKDRYKKYDVLIMDDIQFLSGREKTQEELFHLFNTLQNEQKQIIFSSDKHPNYIVGLEERLKSRFSAGMIVDVNRPEYESRLAIIKTKLKNLGFQMNDSSLDYVAQNVEGNVRELEGVVNTLMCQAELKESDLNLEEVKSVIKNSVRAKKHISIHDVVQVIAQFYETDHNLVYDKTRRKEIVRIRQIVMYILREDFNISFPHIGRELGGRDHTTVIHSCTKIKNELEESPLLVQELEQIRSMLQTY